MVTAALLSAAVWAVMMLAWHGFWRADQRLEPAAAEDYETWPEVVVIIPARNEADSIEAVLKAHAASAYPGPFSVIVLDDNSTDGTQARAKQVAATSSRKMWVVPGQSLPPGWSGKLWAVAQGIEAARITAPDAPWLLLTDADIVHAPHALTRLVAKARASDAVLVSLMARLDSDGVIGQLLVPAYVFFFQKLYPFRAVNDPRSGVSGAAGGCMLVDRARLAETGGIEAVCDALIDDCALAARLKGTAQGERPYRATWLGLSSGEVVSLRNTARLGTIWETVARTAFPQLRRSWLLLAFCVLGMAFLYLAGPAAAVTGLWFADGPLFFAGALPWALQSLAFLPTLRAYDGEVATAALLPLAAFVYMVMTLDSARRDLMGKASPWKGRTYSDLG